MIPKRPADRNNRLRELAEGESCTVLFPGGACDPATTVWAHTNALTDEKGGAYKGHDSAGIFACHRCHCIIDQPGPRSPPLAVRQRYLSRAQERTDVRLLEIATSPTMRPWKIEAARWALAQRAKRKEQP